MTCVHTYLSHVALLEPKRIRSVDTLLYLCHTNLQRRSDFHFLKDRTRQRNFTAKVRSTELYPRLDKRSRHPIVRQFVVDDPLCPNAPHRLEDIFSDASVLVC
jgi:hypothetical protein